MKHLITAEELLTLQNNNEPLVLFDCRFSLGDPDFARNSYLEEHIVGAYLIDLDRDLSDPVGTHGGNHPFRDPQALKALLESFAVTNESTIVIYDQGDLSGPARMLIQLLHLGLEQSYILAGGIDAYKAAGGTVTSGEPPAKPEATELNIQIDPDMLVDMNYVKSKLYADNTIIVDSRSHPRYLGLEEPVYRLAGHIPSAVNYHYEAAIEDGRVKSDDFLKQHFAGLIGDKEIILSCGSGVSACVNSLALRQIGLPHKIYPGSYSDWLSYPENEVKTGEE